MICNNLRKRIKQDVQSSKADLVGDAEGSVAPESDAEAAMPV
jgi:hypothetical protein